jgi:hypothetical protein
VTAELAEDFVAFCLAFNVSLFDWQREDFGRALRRDNARLSTAWAASRKPSAGHVRVTCGSNADGSRSRSNAPVRTPVEHRRQEVDRSF